MALLKKTSEPGQRGSKNYRRRPLTTYYRSEGAQGSSSPFNKKPPPKNRRKLFAGAADLVLLAILILALANSLLISSAPKVTVTSTAYRSLSDYQPKVKQSFGGVGNRNKISFNETGVIKGIQAQFPEVSAVQIELPFFSQQPKVTLAVAPPVFRLNSAGHSLVVDSQGLAVAEAQSIASSSKLPVIDDQSGFQASAGRQVLSTQAVDFINYLIKQCRVAKVPLASLTLPVSPQELDVKTADQPYFIKFYLAGDPQVEVGQFLSTRHQFSQAGVTPNTYLDVRVSGKIFYK